MELDRAAGVLLHPTSLPGHYGVGDLGPEAYHFVHFLEVTGQRLWQVFPLGPTGYQNSPYQSFSAFAGNPILISPDKLAEDGLLDASDLQDVPEFSLHHADFERVIGFKNHLFQKAFIKFRKDKNGACANYDAFCEENRDWLDDYALFMACNAYHNKQVWTKWDEDIAFRRGNALEKWRNKLSEEIAYHKFIQCIFFRQWNEIKTYANSRDIKIIGDLPIGVSYDSSDLWANRELFTVDEKGNLYAQAGVPPDYFSATGQLWGLPLYRWDVMQKDDFAWWRKRFSRLFKMIDILRIDHFRGFDAYWEIPGGAPTAEKGRWVKAPGEALFKTIRKHIGNLPIIAEDLGVITQSVRDLRDTFHFPGIKILQFAFGSGGTRDFLPHNYPKNCVVYTGSHDNDTTRGFFEKEKHNGSDVFTHAQSYTDYYGDDIRFEIIRLAYASVANTVIIPMQDMLNLGSDARMNMPGRAEDNWTWRFSWDQIDEHLSATYRHLSELYERNSFEKTPEVEIDVESS